MNKLQLMYRLIRMHRNFNNYTIEQNRVMSRYTALALRRIYPQQHRTCAQMEVICNRMELRKELRELHNEDN